MKKERPILFNTDMVQAIEKRIKDLTRRTKGLERVNINPDEWEFERIDGMNGFHFKNKKSTNLYQVEFCPYGVPGDILWVRESFAYAPLDEESIIHYPNLSDYIYKAQSCWTNIKWKPSIHMPKKACRFKMEIVSLGLERLCDITKEDAIKEGIQFTGYYTKSNGQPIDFYLDYLDVNHNRYSDPIFSFRSLWQSINGIESWEANPWVWRIQFKIVFHILN